MYISLNFCKILSINLKAVFRAQIYQDVKNRNQRQMTMTQRHNSHNHSGSSGSDSQSSVRRKQEDNLAVVFMGIVLVFGVCHAPRLFLSLYEMIDIRRAMDCSVSWGSEQGQRNQLHRGTHQNNKNLLLTVPTLWQLVCLNCGFLLPRQDDVTS